MSLATLCNLTADIERPTYTADAVGGQTATFAVQYDDVPGRLHPISGRMLEYFAKRSMHVTHVFYTPVEVTVLAGDRLVIGSSYYVVQYGEDQAGQGDVFAVYVKKLD